MTLAGNRILLWGGGSQSRIVEEMIRESMPDPELTIFDSSISKLGFPSRAEFVSCAGTLKSQVSSFSCFVVCIGGLHGYARYRTGKALEDFGLEPLTMIHSEAFLERTANRGAGLLMMPRAVVHKFSSIGEYVLINTSSCVDHECSLGDGVHIMGGAAVAGRVKIGRFASIGTNATILPDIEIGEGAVIGAGAVVTSNVNPYEVVVGVPARKVRQAENRFHSADLEMLK